MTARDGEAPRRDSQERGGAAFLFDSSNPREVA